MKIERFEYKKNCKEFQIIAKAVSPEASRKELKQGQQLFKSIYEKIEAINIKIEDIEESMIRKTFKNKIGDLDGFTMEFDSELENNLVIERLIEMDIYHGTLEPQIELVSKFLHPDFDHELHKKKVLESREYFAKNKTVPNVLIFGNEYEKHKLEEYIDYILRYYSNLSIKLFRYLAMFFACKTPKLW